MLEAMPEKPQDVVLRNLGRPVRDWSILAGKTQHLRAGLLSAVPTGLGLVAPPPSSFCHRAKWDWLDVSKLPFPFGFALSKISHTRTDFHSFSVDHRSIKTQGGSTGLWPYVKQSSLVALLRKGQFAC